MQMTFMEELYLEKILLLMLMIIMDGLLTPFMKTCINGHKEVFNLLFDLKDSKTLTLMLKSIMEGLYLGGQRSKVSKMSHFH